MTSKVIPLSSFAPVAAGTSRQCSIPMISANDVGCGWPATKRIALALPLFAPALPLVAFAAVAAASPLRVPRHS